MSGSHYDVLFVCTANQCRSPMAEYLYRHQFCAGGRRRCASAGIIATPGVPASRFAVTAMQELSIDIRDHRSAPLTASLLNQSRVVAVMTDVHRQLIMGRFPACEGRIVLLGAFDAHGPCEPADIADPVGLSLEVYRAVRDRIAAALWGLETSLIEKQGTD